MEKKKLTQQELFETQNNGEENKKENVNTKIIEKEQIENTPFWILKTEQGWFAVIGDNRLSEHYETQEEAIKYLEDNHWMVTMQVCAIMYKKMKEEDEKNNGIQKLDKAMNKWKKQKDEEEDEKKRYADNSIPMNEAMDKWHEQVAEAAMKEQIKKQTGNRNDIGREMTQEEAIKTFGHQ